MLMAPVDRNRLPSYRRLIFNSSPYSYNDELIINFFELHIVPAFQNCENFVEQFRREYVFIHYPLLSAQPSSDNLYAASPEGLLSGIFFRRVPCKRRMCGRPLLLPT